MLQAIEVIFSDPKHNYKTSVSWTISESNLRDYFVNQTFNVGQYPTDDWQECIDINLIVRNPEVNPK